MTKSRAVAHLYTRSMKNGQEITIEFDDVAHWELCELLPSAALRKTESGELNKTLQDYLIHDVFKQLITFFSLLEKHRHFQLVHIKCSPSNCELGWKDIGQSEEQANSDLYITHTPLPHSAAEAKMAPVLCAPLSPQEREEILPPLLLEEKAYLAWKKQSDQWIAQHAELKEVQHIADDVHRALRESYQDYAKQSAKLLKIKDELLDVLTQTAFRYKESCKAQDKKDFCDHFNPVFGEVFELRAAHQTIAVQQEFNHSKTRLVDFANIFNRIFEALKPAEKSAPLQMLLDEIAQLLRRYQPVECAPIQLDASSTKIAITPLTLSWEKHLQRLLADIPASMASCFTHAKARQKLLVSRAKTPKAKEPKNMIVIPPRSAV